MKNFHEFITENNSEQPDTLEKFLKQVKEALKKDFKNTDSQADTFIDQYIDILEDSWKNGYTVREAIASTKIPGVKTSNGKISESFIFDIDTDFEKAYETIDNISEKQELMECEDVINNYHKKYYKMNFSDMRIFERVKNNYVSLRNLYEQKINQIL